MQRQQKADKYTDAFKRKHKHIAKLPLHSVTIEPIVPYYPANTAVNSVAAGAGSGAASASRPASGCGAAGPNTGQHSSGVRQPAAAANLLVRCSCQVQFVQWAQTHGAPRPLVQGAARQQLAVLEAVRGGCVVLVRLLQSESEGRAIASAVFFAAGGGVRCSPDGSAQTAAGSAGR